jgi:hypothetical protein
VSYWIHPEALDDLESAALYFASKVSVRFEDTSQIPRDGMHHPLSGASAFDQNDHVIGIARKASTRHD